MYPVCLLFGLLSFGEWSLGLGMIKLTNAVLVECGSIPRTGGSDAGIPMDGRLEGELMSSVVREDS